MSINIVIDPPLPTDSREVFDAKALTAWARLGQLGPQITAAADGINESATAIGSAKVAAETAATTATTKAGEASASAAVAGNAKVAAETAATTATTKAGEASASATASATAKSAAETAANTATTKAGQASDSATASATAKSAAETAANTAATKAGQASDSATAAATAKSAAETAANAATTEAGQAGDSATDAATAKNAAEAAANAATTKAGEASTSATAAANSAAAAQQAAQQAAGGGEPTIQPGAAGDYWAGNKTWQPLNKAAVSLGSVDNTADADKPVSTAAVQALALKADLVNGKVPAVQLPSFVDDVREYADAASLPAVGESGVLYITLDLLKYWRWTGSVYAEINPSPGSTDAVPEGAVNRYFTDARAQAAVQAALDGKQPVIEPGAAGQYWAGDKSWRPLDKTAVGLANVNNTSDANKPVSTATQTALNAKQATLSSGVNIKTVGGISLLGSGDVPVSGAGGAIVVHAEGYAPPVYYGESGVAWNAIQSNTLSGASVGASVVILPAGTFLIQAWVIFAGQNCPGQLRMTGGTFNFYGPVAFAGTPSGVGTATAHIAGTLTTSGGANIYINCAVGSGAAPLPSGQTGGGYNCVAGFIAIKL
jgi:hypothetical protein